MPDPDPRLEGKFGWDGRNGEQPRFTTVYGNLAYRLGIWEKQSSFYFQGKSCQNNITARPSLIPSLSTQFTRAGIEWRR